MRVCLISTLFWLAHIFFSPSINGEDLEDAYKPRRWISAGEGPYRLIVSSETESLDPEESVSLAAAQAKKERGKVSGEDYDKVTQRIILKRTRKRDRLSSEILNQRKRRRNPTSSTTGLPQTMSYNLYNHFRPLEQDVPQDHLIPFLDFGKKLSTPSGSDGSSTPKVDDRDEDDVFHEDMDVTVMKKAVERNSAPRGPIQLKPTHIASFFTSNSSEPSLHVNKTVQISNDTSNVQIKTDHKDVHYDLQSNESGIKLHAVLSPNYGLRLNKTEKETTNRTESSTEAKGTNSTTEADHVNITSTERAVTEKVETSPQLITESNVELDQPLSKVNIDNSERDPFPVPIPAPRPTARILSTAVVTSVSVKETLPRLPRLKPNITRPETYQRLMLKNTTSENITQTPHISHDPRLRLDNYTLIGLQNARRKPYTTLRPKTTTYRPVTFRSAFRRNMTGLGTGVVHVVSTPPTYIEVPKIITNPPVRLAHIDTKQFPARVQNFFTTVATSFRPSTARSSTSLAPIITSSSTAPIETTSISVTTTARPTTIETSSVTTATSPPSTTAGTTTTTISAPAMTTSHLIATEGFPSDYPMRTELGIVEDISGEVENATVHIEFKPLDTLRTSSTTEPSGKELGKRPSLLWIYNQRNHSILRNQPVGVAYPESQIGLVTYVLAALALIPLILGLSVLVRQIFRKSKKKVLDESEYSSEYNRTPLPTKLPRVPPHINWEAEKQTSQTVTVASAIPVTKWEFSRDKLRLQTVLGQGNFGQVWKAEADDLSGHEGSTRLVAVKTVKEGASLREKEDLLRELGIMQELGAHPNVVTLLGCCTEKEPYLLIMEYVMYGKLLAFLREHRTRAHYFNFSDLSSALTSRDLTVFAYCVARGMEYLVTKGIIHRDLAARNILVDHTKLCKIADFGMSRNVRDTGQIYEQRPNRGALPIRWMAPESLHLSLFTHKSDVWSFGILMWEIVTLGSTPYNKMGGREVMRQVMDGYRLEKPKHCRSELYKVLTKCWHNDPGKRPSFTDLKQDLAALLADEETNGEYVDLEALTDEMCDQNN
ncbi:uncharacterized protein [Halyomorpha halys]|uniref:uncharacterized protein n=1 Tax=Halyomorpha halys TaxID=286706 RepID=UPI0006D50B73|nr:uncharacterized protein LOC106683775 [Halyomorpha halys]